MVVKPWALLISNRFARWMFNFGCLCLNQYHQKSLGTSFQNVVGLVWVTFATFHLSCCSVMENPHSYIFKTHATTTWFFSFVITQWLNLSTFSFSFKWSESEVIGMHQNLLAPCKEVLPCSITSMVVFNDSFN